MRRRLATLGIVLMTATGLMAQQGAKPAGQADDSVAKALIALENQWVAASKAANPDALAPLLADNFVSLDSDGTMRTKAEVLARTKKAKWATNELGDMKVTVHGDSAIVTGSWTGKGTDGAGKAIDAKERWLDTWVKMPNGKWQCVGTASAPMK